MPKKLILILMLGMLILSGCAQADAGLIKVQETCVVTNTTGNCKGSMQEIRNDNVKTYEKIFTNPEQYAYMNFSISIETGSLQVEVYQYGGTWYALDVTPEVPGTYSGWVNADADGNFSIKYHQIGKQAVKNIQYDFDIKQ